jgi:GNAT superfamily N-acetyltransferase
MAALEIRPLTAERFPDLAALFGQGGDPKTCWCTFWRVRNKEWSLSDPGGARARMEALADHDPPAGLLGYSDGDAVGWVSLGPREDFARLEHSKVRPRLDDVPVWSIVCFVVSRQVRKQGLARELLDAAIAFARRRGAPAVEAYPVDTGGGKVPAANLYTGSLSMFLDAGFRVVREVDSPTATVRRVIVRRDLA